MNFFQSLFYSKAESRSTTAASIVFKPLSTGVFGKMKYKEAVAEGYQSIVWIYRCIRKMGEALGSVPWSVVRIGPDGTKTPIPGHPLEKLLNQPNPYCDRREFFEGWITYLSLSGNDFIEIVYSGKLPVQMYHLRPDWMTPLPDPKLYISGYELRPDGQKKVLLEPRDVMHFKYLDPLNEYRGMSPLTAAARTIQTENSIIGWNKGMLDNNAIPGGVLTVPAQTLMKEDRLELQDELESEFATEGKRHRPMVLWGGMDWKQMGLTQRDMDFLQQKKLNKYELCAVLGVPPQVVGANEDPTYSNYGTARLSFWEDLIILLLDWLQSRFNARLAPLFGPDIHCQYDISDVPAMRESFQQKANTAATLWKMGWPINAINQRLSLGFDPVPWGDTAWMPASMVPVGGQAPIGSPDGADPDEDPDVEPEDPEEGAPSGSPSADGQPDDGQGAIPRFTRSRSALGKLLEGR